MSTTCHGNGDGPKFPKTANEKALLQEVKEDSSRFIHYNTSIKKEKSVEDHPGKGKDEKCYLEEGKRVNKVYKVGFGLDEKKRSQSRLTRVHPIGEETKSKHQIWERGRMHEKRSGITNM